jgi:hypothetical protein
MERNPPQEQSRGEGKDSPRGGAGREAGDQTIVPYAGVALGQHGQALPDVLLQLQGRVQYGADVDGEAMRIRLDFDDGPVFSTVRWLGGRHRALVVKINGKPFSVWRTLEDYEQYRGEDYMRAVDDALIAAMEQMFTNIFMDACAAIPDGTELLKDDK